MCDYCTPVNKKLDINPEDPCKLNYLIHQKKVLLYADLRKDFINKGKTDPKLK